MEPGPCVVCGAFAHNGHHRKLRSQGGGDEHWNLIRLCGSGTTGCHGLIHANPEAAYAAGLLVHSWDNPREVPVAVEAFKIAIDIDGDGGLEPVVEHDHAAVEEGQECPTCHRRVPKKKKPTSPTTKVRGFRVPVDDVEAYAELEEQAAKHLGVYEKSHWQFWLHQYALALLLQDPSLKDALKPEPKS